MIRFIEGSTTLQMSCPPPQPEFMGCQHVPKSKMETSKAALGATIWIYKREHLGGRSTLRELSFLGLMSRPTALQFFGNRSKGTRLQYQHPLAHKSCTPLPFNYCDDLRCYKGIRRYAKAPCSGLHAGSKTLLWRGPNHARRWICVLEFSQRFRILRLWVTSLGKNFLPSPKICLPSFPHPQTGP